MRTEALIAAARLQDEEQLARLARQWTNGPDGAWFLSLDLSQLASLERALLRTQGPVRFQLELRRFLSEAERRGRSIWTKEHVVALRQTFRQASHLGRKETGDTGKAFARCLEVIERSSDDTKTVRRKRIDVTLRTYLGMLAKRRRSAKKGVIAEQCQ